MRPGGAVFLAALLQAGIPSWVLANDTAAAIATGGVVPRDERRVSMLKERLAIRMLEKPATPGFAPYQVDVEYEFANGGSEPVETEVAFPAPSYRYELSRLRALTDFKAWVDGKEIPVTKQTRAMVDGKDQAPLLRELGIDVETFGNYEWSDEPGTREQIRRLPADALTRLAQLGIVGDTRRGYPQWTVETTFHWRQSFPVGKVRRVRHRYTPYAGYENHEGAEVRDLMRIYRARACPTDAVARELEEAKAALEHGGGHPTDHVSWVDYILTTANSWKTPIRNFELVVESPKGWVPSLCWSGAIERSSRGQLVARARDFVPSAELRIYFFAIK